MSTLNAYAATTVVGLVAGLRSMTAPAVVSRAANCGALHIHDPHLHFLASNAAANTFTALAAGEIVADKTSVIGNRTDPGPLAGRILSGALCGAAICSAKKESLVIGALLGSLAAIGGTFLGYEVRRRATQDGKLPDLPVALAEDAIAVGAGLAAVHG